MVSKYLHWLVPLHLHKWHDARRQTARCYTVPHDITRRTWCVLEFKFAAEALSARDMMVLSVSAVAITTIDVSALKAVLE